MRHEIDKLELNYIERFQTNGILTKDHNCYFCCTKLKLVGRRRNQNARIMASFRCPKCEKYQSVYRNSFFSFLKSPLLLIVEIIKFWCAQITISKTYDILKIDNKITNKSKYVVSNVYRLLRNLCSASVKNTVSSIKIGGNGKVVEIDESLVSKVKYNRGKGLKKKQIWMFGLVEREMNGRCYIETVPDRKAETLLKIIFDRVEEGTTIISDSWSSYEKLKDLYFNHFKVNHKYNFLDPITGAHTNKIEGLWKHAKESFKQ